MNKQVIVGGAVLIMGLGFVLAATLYEGQEQERVQAIVKDEAAVLAPAHAISKGPQHAKVTIVEFFDPACESCARVYRPVKELLAAFPDQVRLVLRYAPLHVGSEGVCRMLEAARRQDRYWQVLDVMFATQSQWASHHHPQPDLLWELIPAAGVDIDMDRLRADAAEFAIGSLVQQDVEDGAKLGVRQTPTFLVNGRPLPSFGLQQLHTLVSEEVAANY